MLNRWLLSRRTNSVKAVRLESFCLEKSTSVRLFLAACLILGLAGCVGNIEESGLLSRKLESLPARGNEKPAKDIFGNASETDITFNGLDSVGTDKLVGKSSQLKIVGDDEGDIKLNLLDVPVAAAAKAVLGDALGVDYSVDSRVQGTVTIQTSKEIGRKRLLTLFRGALKGIGATIVGDNEIFRIVPIEEAGRSTASLDDGESELVNPGNRAKIVQIRYVSASEIAEVIAPLVPPSMSVKTDRNRNSLILSGAPEEIATLRDAISVFDVDWMKGMSFALVPVRSSQPSAIVADLDQIYNTKKGPLKGVVRFVPNLRLKSVLVITARSKYLREAKDWIRKLDVLAEGNEEGLHVYKVQNRTAGELAKVLQSVLAVDGQVGGGAKRRVAPKLEEVETTDAAAVTSGPETPQTGLGSDEDLRRELAENTYEATVDTGEGQSKVRVVADDANNSLLIFATAGDFERIKAVLEEVDSQPNQVLLEAVIAEVSLDDELKFGVRWGLGDAKQNGTFSDLVSGAVAQSFPGFSYLLKANDIGFTLNALSSVTDVRVLSSPSLLVLDNKTAVLQVGDQVPIVSQQAKGTASGDAPIVNSVELKDTGVILSVTPRVNDSGRVILDIEQEVSSVVKTTTSGIDSPTIRQRKIKTSVVLTDGQAMALGGLIQEKEITGQAKVPVLGDVPILKNAFRSKTNSVARTELIIFIRPRVVRDMDEARDITEEFRAALDVQAPRVRRKDPTPGEELVRILN